MKVFRVDVDDRFPLLTPDGEFERRYGYAHDPHIKFRDGWEPLCLRREKKTPKEGDFWEFSGYAVVARRQISEAMRECLQEDVEILPVIVTDRAGEFDLWHVTNIVDALDVENTTFESWGMPIHWAFQRNKLTRPMLFRVLRPHTIVFAATDIEPRNLDFYARYQAIGATGLRFKSVWEEGTECPTGGDRGGAPTVPRPSGRRGR